MAAKNVPLAELIGRLGEPAGSGVQVMYGIDAIVPQYRTAKMMWLCDPVRSADPEAGCPSNCFAQNHLPYTTIEFEPRNFPEDAWILTPCVEHSRYFVEYPDAGAAQNTQS